MMTKIHILTLTAASLLVANLAAAQAPASTDTTDPAVRPATATVNCDTGLWFVPTADMLERHTWSFGAYRTGLNYVQGFTNVGTFSGSVAYGLFRGIEVFGAFNVDTRINRDVRTLFTTDKEVGGVTIGQPFVKTGWTGDNLGDLYVGMKSALVQQRYGRHPYSLAIREVFKIPTADKDKGIGTGKLDTSIEGILSSDINKKVELTGYGGVTIRGKSVDISLPKSLTWGVGAGFPSHSAFRATAELNGDVLFDDTTTISQLTGTDGSRSLTTYSLHNFTAATFGLTWQSRRGFYIGGGASWNFPTKDRAGFSLNNTDVTGDFVDYQVRIGFHPGSRQYYIPPPVAPQQVSMPPPPPVMAVHTLSVRVQADPSTVEVGKSSTITATVQDSTNCAVTYRVTAPAGTFANPSARQTLWTAPNQEGAVPVTVTVTCPADGKTATESVTVQVIKPAPVVELAFDDVYFDFDRSTLRPEALRLLDDAVTKLQANPAKNIVIEGHTCNIGTAEYNLALGERRAASVRGYLTSRGIAAGRMETRSYGEESPKFDNTREETRRLNRRAALVVKVQ